MKMEGRDKKREKNALYIWCLSRSHVLQREHAFSWGVTCWSQSAQQDTMTLRSFLSWNSMQKHLLKCSSKTRSRACLGSCAIFGSREAANGESRRKSGGNVLQSGNVVTCDNRPPAAYYTAQRISLQGKTRLRSFSQTGGGKRAASLTF